MSREIVNKHSFSELALLAVFASGLFWGNLLVKNRSGIHLDNGIGMAGSGLRVHLPLAQDGWNSLKEWQYQQNNYYILAARYKNISTPPIDVEWRYCLSGGSGSCEEILKEYSESAKAILLETSTVESGKVKLLYGRMQSQMGDGDLYFGAAVLDFGRVILLQVKSRYDLYFARDLFIGLAESIEYNPSQELTDGVSLLGEARGFGAEKFFASEEGHNLLIRDSAAIVCGYETTQIKQDSEGLLRIDRITVLNTAPTVRKENHFESSSPCTMFDWKCRYRSVSGQSSTFELKLDTAGLLQVRDPSGKKQSCQAGPAAVSEIALDGIIRYFLDTAYNRVVLDVITSEGNIIPAIISSILPETARAGSEDMAYAVRIEFIGLNAWEYYYSGHKKLIGKVSFDNRRGDLLWEPSTKQEIDKYFDTRPIRNGPTAKKDGTFGTYPCVLGYDTIFTETNDEPTEL